MKSNVWIGEKLSRCHTTIGRCLQKYDQNATICRAKAVVEIGKARSVKTEKSSDLLREIMQSVQMILKKSLT